MEGKEEMHPRPKAQRGGKSRGDLHLLRVKGVGICTSSPFVSQPIQGRGREGRAIRVGKGDIRAGGKPTSKLPASFRLTDSCTFLLTPLRGSSSPQKTSFCSFSPKKSSLIHSPLSIASCKWPGQVSRHYHRMEEED